MITQTINMLGLTVKDKITGQTGIIESVCFDLYGCVQVGLKPRELDKDGKPQDGRWTDINRVEVISGGERVMPVPAFQARESNPAHYDRGPADKSPLPSR